MKTRVLSITTALLLAGTAIVSSAADKVQSTAPSAQTQEFLREAVHGNLAEVKLGQLAQKKGQTDGVRSMGAMLEKHHSKANIEATQVAQQLKVAPPREPSAEQKATYDRLAKLSGAEFDKEFIKEAVNAHQKTIKKYEEAQAQVDNPAAAYAKETLPVVRSHLKMAQDLESKQVPTS